MAPLTLANLSLQAWDDRFISVHINVVLNLLPLPINFIFSIHDLGARNECITA